MNLVEIKIINYRNFRRIKINPQNFNVVIGPNESGKSNFLFALNSIFNLRPYQFTEFDFYDIYKPIRIKLKFNNFTPNENALFHSYFELENDEVILRISLFCKYNLEEERPDYPRLKFLKVDENLKKNEREFFNYLFIDTNRDILTEIKGKKISYWNKIKQILQIKNEEIEQIINSNDNIERILQSNEDISFLKAELRNILSLLLKRDNNLIDIKISDLDENDIKKSISLKINHEVEGLPIERLSDGFRSLAAISIFQSYKKIQERRGTYLFVLGIDEPEIHLHGHLQRNLIKILRETGIQIFLTTHSTFFIDRIKPTELIVFRAKFDDYFKKSYIISRQIKSNDLTDDDIKNFKRYYHSNISEMFFSRRTILVEGDTEELCLPIIAGKLNVDLDKKEITIINLKSIDNLNPFLKILKKLDLNYALILDNEHLDKIIEKIRDLGILSDQIHQELLTKNQNEKIRELESYFIFIEPFSNIEETFLKKLGISDMEQKIRVIGRLSQYQSFIQQPQIQTNLEYDKILKFLNSRRQKPWIIPLICEKLNSDEIPDFFINIFNKINN